MQIVMTMITYCLGFAAGILIATMFIDCDTFKAKLVENNIIILEDKD